MGYVMHVDAIPAEERGITKNEWLTSYHTYSFGTYQNLKRVNFGSLRVFNDDVVEPGKGFGTHGHDNMEIVTIVLEGALAHKDSTGASGVIRAGDIQRMTASSGIFHSEYNASKEDKVHFLQIWVTPEKKDLTPGYEQKTVDLAKTKNRFHPIVSKEEKEEKEGSLSIHQDATFYLGEFDSGQKIEHRLQSKKHGDLIFVIEGEVNLSDQSLKKGDSAQITDTELLELQVASSAKILLIEVERKV